MDHDELSHPRFIASQNPAHLAGSLPAWIRNGDPATVHSLADSLQRSRHFQTLLHQHFAPLLAPRAFAEPLFDLALAERFGEGLDADAVVLVRGEHAGKPVRQSLLDAALHNFSEGQVADPDQPEFSFAGQASYEPELGVPAFVDFCRQCNLGERYRRYLDSRFRPAPQSGQTPDQAERAVASLFTQSVRHDLEVALHLARLQGRLDGRFHECLVNEVQGRGVGYFQSVRLTFQRLTILDCPLSEVFVCDVSHPLIGPLGPFQTQQIRLALYVPGDTQGELQCFDSYEQMMNALHRRLADDDFRRYFSRFVAHRALPHWLERLERRLFLEQGSRRRYNPDGALAWSTETVKGDLAQALFNWRRDLIYDNARFQAVPTGDIDQAERQAVLHKALVLGLDLLGLASFVVPGLGAVMLGVAAVEMMGLVYEGIEDWQQGDRQEAFDCFTEVVEQVALGAVVGVGVAVGARFFHGLRSVVLADGSVRLGHRRLLDYRTDVELPATVEPDALGIYTHDGGHYLHIDDGWYPIEPDADQGGWRLIHPRRPEARPASMVHDGAGGWRMVEEVVADWPGGGYLVRRFGGDCGRLDPAQAEQVLQICAIDEAQLRQWHRQGTPPSGVLQDTAWRMSLAARLDRFEVALREAHAGLDDTLLRLVLPRLSGWPAALSVDAVVASGHVELESSPTLLGILQRLTADQRDGLFPAGLVEQSDYLRLQAMLYDQAMQDRSLLFEALYQADEQSASTAAAVLIRDFPGLPRRVAQRLVADASEAELDRLKSKGQVPLRLAEQAWQQRAQVRVARQLEPFYLRVGEGPHGSLAQVSAEVADTRAWMRRAERSFRPPQRVGQRIGYPLSGRARVDLVFQGIRRELLDLYPAFTEQEVRSFLVSERFSSRSLRHELNRLRNELSQLRRQLHDWVSAAAEHRERVSRNRVAAELLRGWQRQGTRVHRNNGSLQGFALSLSGLRVGDLPVLDPRIDFSHVVELSMPDMQLNTVPAAFIERFSGLRLLDLSHNALEVIPDLGHVPGLDRLYLHSNRIGFDSIGQARLGVLTALRELDLSNNPLGRPPVLHRHWHLTRLSLRNVQIDSLPAGTVTRPMLRFADLRDNRLSRLPDALFDEPATRSRVLLLDGNPLTLDSRRRFEALSSVASQRVERLLEQAAAVDLRDFWGTQDSLLADLWNSLFARAEAQPLHDLLTALARSVTSPLQRADLTPRLWSLLTALGDDPRLAEEVFALAEHPVSRADDVQRSFAALETRRALRDALLTDTDEEGGRQRLELARALFRLRTLEEVALQEAGTRPGLASDPLELGLAYRAGLGRRLNLPAHARLELPERIAPVSESVLEQVRNQVLGMERGPHWPAFLQAQDFWVEFLHQRYFESFEALNLTLYEELETLQAANLPDAELIDSANRLHEAVVLREQALVQRLTRDVLTANDEAIVAREYWAGQSSARQRAWDLQVEGEQARGLRHLLERLSTTFAAQNVREDLSRRVWALIDSLPDDPEVARQVLAYASELDSADGARGELDSFSALETHRLYVLATAAPVDGTGAAPRLQLIRGQFRLDRLDRIARHEAATRPGQLTHMEDFSLAYRSALSRQLELPGQASTPIFAQLLRIEPRVLGRARRQVLAAEQALGWWDFLERQGLWRDYLRKRFAAQFSALQVQRQAWFEGAPVERLPALQVLWAQREQRLVAQLTQLSARGLEIVDVPGRVFWTQAHPLRQGRWDSWVHDPEATGLFELLQRLQQSFEVRLVSDDVVARVWTIIDACARDRTLAGQVMERADQLAVEATDVLAQWSQIEIVALRREMVLSNFAQPEDGLRRLDLARGLFRLERLHAWAREQAVSTQARVADLDLGYRSALAGVLNLPAQSATPTFAVIARLDTQALAEAQTWVLAQERDGIWPLFLSRQDFWVTYLRQNHARAFRALADTLADELARWPDQSETLRQAFAEREHGLVARLSEQARLKLDRIDPQPGPSSAGGR